VAKHWQSRVVRYSWQLKPGSRQVPGFVNRNRSSTCSSTNILSACKSKRYHHPENVNTGFPEALGPLQTLWSPDIGSFAASVLDLRHGSPFWRCMTSCFRMNATAMVEQQIGLTLICMCCAEFRLRSHHRSRVQLWGQQHICRWACSASDT
jgi:hypothetical protein